MSRLSRLASIAGALTLVMAIVVTGGARFCARELPNRLTEPGLAIQLAGSRADVEKIVGMTIWCPGVAPSGLKPECLASAESLYAQQWRDFAFIPVYVAFLVLVGLMVWRTGRWGRVLGSVSIAAALVAGLADVRENLTIVTLLGPYPVCTAMPRPWALLKWRLLVLTFVMNIPLFTRAGEEVRGLGRWAGYAAAALAVATLYFTGMQLAGGDDTYLESALPVAVATMLMTWVAVSGRAWFPTGLLAGLDALARRPGFRRIAGWPPTQ